MKLVNLRQLESKLMWSSITAAVKSKMAVESKATHMGPEGYYGTEGYVEGWWRQWVLWSTGQKVLNTE
jgi:hypothetical protein